MFRPRARSAFWPGFQPDVQRHGRRVRAGRAGAVAEAEIADNGPSVAAEMREWIFDPFFTTRAAGEGLGLWVGRNIPTRLGGDIEVKSRGGSLGMANSSKGTAFIVRIPAVPPERKIAPGIWPDSPLFRGAFIRTNRPGVFGEIIAGCRRGAGKPRRRPAGKPARPENPAAGIGRRPGRRFRKENGL
ncbi:MAG: ATP-binding protein, partial [Desulfococcaceae bacterium]